MYLTRHQTLQGPRWALDGHFLAQGINLNSLLALPRSTMHDLLQGQSAGPTAEGPLLTPMEGNQEVWGAGVTYLRSRQAREAESTTADVYAKVYDAERPEIFFKSIGWRAVGHGQSVRIRKDTTWNVPEPELTLVINAAGEIVGYTVGNDMSSRDIEGANPLYLPQAKTYDGSCGVGPGIRLVAAETLTSLPISVQILRDGTVAFAGEVTTDNMKRMPEELVAYLFRETTFPHGALLMTGTGIVPPDDFTLTEGDVVRVTIDGLTLENQVA